jgi:YgiT-type zinc finger domain-containing protein
VEARLTRCFHCGSSDLEEREVEELISAGDHVVRCRALATICHHCGERYFDAETVQGFEAVRERVAKGDLSGLRFAGSLFEPAA